MPKDFLALSSDLSPPKGSDGRGASALHRAHDSCTFLRVLRWVLGAGCKEPGGTGAARSRAVAVVPVSRVQLARWFKLTSSALAGEAQVQPCPRKDAGGKDESKREAEASHTLT